MTRIYIQSINSTTSDHVCGYIILPFVHEAEKSEITFEFQDIWMEYLFADTNNLFRLILFLERELGAVHILSNPF